MNDMFKEIEDDIRRERAEKLWHGFGKVMVFVSLGVILFTIGYVVIQDHIRNKASEQTAEFIKGVDRLNIEDYKSAIPIFSHLADDDSSHYYGLAMLRKAQAEEALSMEAEAVKTYTALVQHDVVLGQLAKMLVQNFGGDKDKLLPKPDENTPFYFSQREWYAWNLLEQGKKEQAASEFTSLSLDPKVPSSMRARVTEVLRYVAPAKSTPEAAKAIEAK